NAVKYNHEGGTVTLMSDTSVPGRFRLGVRDTGPGIAADKFDRLFSPFDRLGAEASDVEGTGLGLALSKGLMEAMGGALTVESTEGTGSTFWIELAAADSPLALQQGQLRAADGIAAPAGRTRVLLYIEDNLPNLELIEQIVDRWQNVTLLPAMQGRLGIDL